MSKTQRMMMSVALLAVLCLKADVYASKPHPQLYSFTFENISVKDALLNIREQAGVDFSIDEEIVEGELSNRAISKFYADKPLEKIITDIFRYDNCAMTWSYRSERLGHVRIWIFQTAQETGRAFHHGAPSQMARSPARIAPGNGSSMADFKAPVRSNAVSIGNRKRRPMRSKAGYHQPSAISPSNASVVSDSPETDRSAEVSYPSSSFSYVSKSTSNTSGSSSYVSNPNSNNSGSSSYVSNSDSNNSGSSSYVSNSDSNTSSSSSYVSNPNSNTSGSSSYVSNPNSNNSGSSTSASDSSGTDETTTSSADPDAQTYSTVAPSNAETSSDSLTEENPTNNSEELVPSDEQQAITETENPENETEPETAIALLDDMQIEITLSRYLYGLE